MAQENDSAAKPLTDLANKVENFFKPKPKSEPAKSDPYATPMKDSAAYKASQASSNQQAQNNRQAKTAKKYKGAGL